MVKEKFILKRDTAENTLGVSPQRTFRAKTVNSLHSAWIPHPKIFISICDHCIEVEDKNIQGQLLVILTPHIVDSVGNL